MEQHLCILYQNVTVLVKGMFSGMNVTTGMAFEVKALRQLLMFVSIVLVKRMTF